MLGDSTLMEWARSAAESYAGNQNAPVPHGLRLRDVDLAKDVASLMVPMFFVTRFFMGHRPDHPLVCVEIGTADGSTALPVLKAVAEVGGHLHSVDPSGCEDAHMLVDQFGYRSYWTHHRMASDHFFQTFREPVDFAFIDGDHRWPVVERDMKNCYAALRPGGIMWTSDYSALPADQRSYEHEHDGSTEYREHVPCDPVGDKQMTDGIGKAAHRAIPTFERAQVFSLMVWPNPSILVRKMLPDEIDLRQRHTFRS